ncbi:hypothetical protein JXQ70_04770 [bacterium]|nr:hypothetical protein [bacterium]
MSDSLKDHLDQSDLPEPDRYQQEIERDWHDAIQDLCDQEKHLALINSAQKYYLLDYLAQLYRDYFDHHPTDTVVQEYLNQIFTIAAFTYLQRPNHASERSSPYKAYISLIFFAFLALCLLWGYLFFALRHNLVEECYMNGLQAMFHKNYDKARLCFEKVSNLDHEYKDVQEKLSFLNARAHEKKTLQNVTPQIVSSPSVTHMETATPLIPETNEQSTPFSSTGTPAPIQQQNILTNGENNHESRTK